MREQWSVAEKIGCAPVLSTHEDRGWVIVGAATHVGKTAEDTLPELPGRPVADGSSFEDLVTARRLMTRG